jgi:DNA-binding NtrC family response regulator
MKPAILLIERPQIGTESVRQILDVERYSLRCVANPFEANSFLEQPAELFICDMATGREAALQLVSQWHERWPETPMILLIDNGDVDAAVEGMKLGATECLTRPLDHHRVREVVEREIGTLPTYEEQLSKNVAAVNGHLPSTRRVDIPLGTSLEELERAAVQQALEHHHGNRTHAAKELGISVRTLQRKLKMWKNPMLSFFV